MTRDATTKAVKDLEQYLLEVWDMEQVFRIAHTMNELGRGVQVGRGPDEIRYRELAEQLEQHLFAKYRMAVAEVERVLAEVLPDDACDVLLEKLVTAIQRPINVNSNELGWLAMVQGPFDMYGKLDRRSWKDDYSLKWAESLWAIVQGDISFYIGKIARLIETRATGTAPASPPTLNRIPWTCSTAAYVHIVKELLQRGYIAAPDMNGKEGEANITELFRRLSQAFIVTGSKGSELPPDELQRRFDGRAIAQAKALRLTFPEAKEVK